MGSQKKMLSLHLGKCNPTFLVGTSEYLKSTILRKKVYCPLHLFFVSTLSHPLWGAGDALSKKTGRNILDLLLEAARLPTALAGRRRSCDFE